MYTIESDAICASAWDNAIENVAKCVNEVLGLNISTREWQKLEELANKLNIRFDENGEIV